VEHEDLHALLGSSNLMIAQLALSLISKSFLSESSSFEEIKEHYMSSVTKANMQASAVIPDGKEDRQVAFGEPMTPYLNIGSEIHGPGAWTLSPGPWIQDHDPGSRALHPWLWIQDARSRIQGPGLLVEQEDMSSC
jgi:hypothetical protein